MLHPSYLELMEKINAGCDEDAPLVKSRYSVVLAAARRARQITEIEELTGTGDPKNKPLSQAVRELYNGTTRILNEDEIAEEDAKIEELQRVNRELIKAQQAAGSYGKWATSKNFDDQEEIDAEAETETVDEATEETTENNDEE
ncbi:MAG: DNA-directed RNA polymerase subunit omega [Lachnospiraceae bacterium]|nr:DNA-directed RNA polymerase subunit omega [Lachnospiraceae bacterium]